MLQVGMDWENFSPLRKLLSWHRLAHPFMSMASSTRDPDSSGMRFYGIGYRFPNPEWAWYPLLCMPGKIRPLRLDANDRSVPPKSSLTILLSSPIRQAMERLRETSRKNGCAGGWSIFKTKTTPKDRCNLKIILPSSYQIGSGYAVFKLFWTKNATVASPIPAYLVISWKNRRSMVVDILPLV